MLFLLRSLILLVCLLVGRVSQAQEATFSTTYDRVVDTLDTHFEDHWRDANDALLTASGREALNRGRIRLSLRAMSNPARYGLIDSNAAEYVVTAAQLLCDNRVSGSLQLRCRIPGAPHGRRVQLNDAQCRGAPDLYTLIPDGCRHPYVLTVEGREVLVSRIVQDEPATVIPELTPTPPPPAFESPPPTSDAMLARLHGDLDAERDRSDGYRDEVRELTTKLHRSYLAILLLVLCVVGAAIIAVKWRQRARGFSEQAKGLFHELGATKGRLARSLNTEGSGAFRLDPVLYCKVSGLGSAYKAVRRQRDEALQELAELKRSRDRLPSVVVDTGLEQIAKIVEEHETRRRQDAADIRAAESAKRARLQTELDALRAEVAQSKAHAAAAAQRISNNPPQAVPSSDESDGEDTLVDVETALLGGRDRVNRYGPSAAMTSGRKTQTGIGGPTVQESHQPTLQPPAPADEPSSPPAPIGTLPPPSPSSGDGYRIADCDVHLEPAPDAPSAVRSRAHPELTANDPSEQRPAILPAARVGFRMADGEFIPVDDQDHDA